MDTSKYRIHEVSKGGSGSLGKYEAMLDAETRQVLSQFTKWLEVTGKVPSANSRASYKTYIAKALALPGERLSSNQRSGWRAWEQFLDALEAANQDDSLELDEDFDEREDDVPESGDSE